VVTTRGTLDIGDNNSNAAPSDGVADSLGANVPARTPASASLGNDAKSIRNFEKFLGREALFLARIFEGGKCRMGPRENRRVGSTMPPPAEGAIVGGRVGIARGRRLWVAHYERFVAAVRSGEPA
jgi:hypothetical protein